MQTFLFMPSRAMACRYLQYMPLSRCSRFSRGTAIAFLFGLLFPAAPFAQTPNGTVGQQKAMYSTPPPQLVLGTYEAHRTIWDAQVNYLNARQRQAYDSKELVSEARTAEAAHERQIEEIDRSVAYYRDAIRKGPTVYKGEFETTEEFKARAATEKAAEDKESSDKIADLITKKASLEREWAEKAAEYKRRYQNLQYPTKPDFSGRQQFSVRVDMARYDADSGQVSGFIVSGCRFGGQNGGRPRVYFFNGTVGGIRVDRETARRMREASEADQLGVEFAASASEPTFDEAYRVKTMSDSEYKRKLEASQKGKSEAAGTGLLTFGLGAIAIALGADPNSVNAGASAGGDKMREQWNQNPTPVQYKTMEASVINIGWTGIARPTRVFTIDENGNKTTLWTAP